MERFDIVLGETFKKEFRKLLKKYRSILEELKYCRKYSNKSDSRYATW